MNIGTKILNICKVNLVNPKGGQPWIFIGWTEAEAPNFSHLMQRSDSLEKTLMPGIDSRQEEKGMAENEMAGWHHWFNKHEFEQTPGDGEGQGSLACYSP